ncbi:LOW QUALITY PROTEIN: uncharacterized protein ACR2FA_005372 [Aphomia sociella]
MSNVKLAIRVRPFSERELRSEKDRIPVVNVADHNTVTITNIKVSVSGAGDSRERVRHYYADYTFDSACPVTCPTFANQEKVFKTVGREVIDSLSRGCSACVLAYGQSATGKTHTMMGTETQPGLIPRLCTSLAELHPFDLTISFLDYNERVHDLLAGEVAASTCHSLPRRRGNARKDLRVREHPDRGPYVQNLRRVAVHDAQALLTLVREGAHRRRTAATRRNSTSSRSHALLELTTPTATLHLADLAGSEKASWEGCGGGRQKEGANINKSLVALSNVISALVSGGAGRGRYVPYRDSALTWLLKDCFTGGASTFIIATVSPSVACYGESASTLRWAERARQLPTPRPIHIGPNAVTRAALQTQFNQLLAELTRNYIQYVPETGKILYDDNHWSLQINNKKVTSLDSPNKSTKIGNIMNISYPKTDAQSESTASSVASGSSDVINTMDKNTDIANEINKEVDKLFSPTLERANSGSNLKVIAPLRNKRRQYRSQEVLPIDETLRGQSQSLANTLPSQSEDQINVINKNEMEKLKARPIPILYDSQRSEIVASVTERLYSKLKKKEEAAVSKMESVVDKKIMEPLSELKICTNARQRLIELSHKASRHKRKIGIPAHTQTRLSVTRVRDQAIDVQTDLEAYVYRNRHFYALQRDAATETVPMTPRCKEMASGSKYGSISFNDRSTLTENKQVVYKNSLVMTDNPLMCDQSTQTPIVPPPRKKKRLSSLSRYLKNIDVKKNCSEECNITPVININISQSYPTDPESQSSDDNVGQTSKINGNASNKRDIPKIMSTPDLLTNHSSIDTNDAKYEDVLKDNNVSCVANSSTVFKHNDIPALPKSQQKTIEEFPDTEDLTLPKVFVENTKKKYHEEMKDMILGRNKDVYPYNIVLSPLKDSSNTSKIVKFKDMEVSGKSVASQTNWESENKSDQSYRSNFSSDATSDKEYNDTEQFNNSNLSDSIESSKIETDSFVWRKGTNYHFNTSGNLRRSYTPVYKSQSRYSTAKAKFYREFLGLENNNKRDVNDLKCPYNNSNFCKYSSDTDEGSKYHVSHRRKLLEDTFTSSLKYDPPKDDIEKLETELLNSCDNLEMSVNRYDSYLYRFRNGSRSHSKNPNVDIPIRTPTEYLQHLVQLRREVVKADCDTDTSSSIAVSRK